MDQRRLVHYTHSIVFCALLISLSIHILQFPRCKLNAAILSYNRVLWLYSY